jgi:hypothetical protein
MCGLEDSQKPSLHSVTRVILYIISINGIYFSKTKGRIIKLAFLELIFSKQIPAQYLKLDNNGLISLLSTLLLI